MSGYAGVNTGYAAPVTEGVKQVIAQEANKAIDAREQAASKFLKVFRLKPANGTNLPNTHIATFDYTDLRELEERVYSRFKGGEYRAEVWKDGKKGESFTFTKPGAGLDEAGNLIDEGPEALVVGRDGRARAIYDHRTMRAGARADGNERELALLDDVTRLERLIVERDAELARAKQGRQLAIEDKEAELRREKKAFENRLEDYRDEMRRKIDATEEQARRERRALQDKHDELVSKLAAAQAELKVAQQQAQGANSNDMMKTIMELQGKGAEKFEAMLTLMMGKAFEKNDLTAQLEGLARIKKAFGKDEDEDEDEKGISDTVREVAIAVSTLAANLPWGKGQAAPAPATTGAATEPQAALTASVLPPAPTTAAGMLATEKFGELLDEGVNFEPDPSKWARAAVAEINIEGRSFMAKLKSSTDLLVVLQKVPRLNIEKLFEYLKKNPGKKAWLENALANLKALCAT